MAINPNTPFSRIQLDLPTAVALQLEEAAKTSGKTKKQFISDAVIAYCESFKPSRKKAK